MTYARYHTVCEIALHIYCDICKISHSVWDRLWHMQDMYCIYIHILHTQCIYVYVWGSCRYIQWHGQDGCTYTLCRCHVECHLAHVYYTTGIVGHYKHVRYVWYRYARWYSRWQPHTICICDVCGIDMRDGIDMQDMHVWYRYARYACVICAV